MTKRKRSNASSQKRRRKRAPQSSSDTPAGAHGAGSRGLENALENLALALTSGVLVAVPFLAPALWFLHFVALVPWVVLLTRERVKHAWLYFFVGIYTAFTMASGPFSLFHKAVPFALGWILAPSMVVFAVMLRTVFRQYRIPLTLLVPVVWVASEWLRIQFSIGAAPLYVLGTSQFRQTTLIQIADLTGVAGISFVVAAANGAIADLLVTDQLRWRRVIWPALGFPIILLGVLAYGALRRDDYPVLEGPRIAIIQPNVTHYKDPATVRATVEDQLNFTRAAVPPGSAELVVLPENAVSLPFASDPYFKAELSRLARELSAEIVFGAVTRAPTPRPGIYTSAYHMSEHGEVLNRYDKLHLIPWGEYMPFEPWLSRVSGSLSRAHYALAKKLLGYNSFGVAGRELVVFGTDFQGDQVQFATPICFEISGGAFGREAAKKGADFLLNVTSEGFFGGPVYLHMLAHSTMRAVETRLPVVRVGNHGISGFIDPTGRILGLVRGNRTGRIYLEEGSLTGRVPLRASAGRSAYTRLGDWFSYLCIAASLLLLGFSLRERIRSKASSAPGT